MLIVIGTLAVAFWLGVAFCFVAMEPLARRRIYEEMEHRYRARIGYLQSRLDVETVAEAFRADREYETTALQVVDAEDGE